MGSDLKKTNLPSKEHAKPEQITENKSITTDSTAWKNKSNPHLPAWTPHDMIRFDTKAIPGAIGQGTWRLPCTGDLMPRAGRRPTRDRQPGLDQIGRARCHQARGDRSTTEDVCGSARGASGNFFLKRSDMKRRLPDENKSRSILFLFSAVN
jgi:hypothetical protein